MNIAEQTPEIVVVASCNVDLISYVDRMPQIGETLMGNKFKMGFGGKGANKAIACSRLGSKCAVIAKLGNDVFGKDYVENFKQNGINTRHVLLTDEAATGVAPICVDNNGNNSILVILGANLLLTSENIKSCENEIKNAKILVTNLEIPLETALFSLKLAKSHNVTTILNFAPAISTKDRNLFNDVDYLILNEVEAHQLSGLEIKTVENATNAALSLIDNFKVQIGVIVTLGEMGVVYVNKSTRSSFHKQSQKVRVVDTTGAGDAFVGSFSHFLNKCGNDSVERAIELASEYATLSVQSQGTQSSYPKLNEIDTKFKL